MRPVRNSVRLQFCRLVLSLSAIAAALAASAATWTGGGDGASWGDPNNWGGSIPGASEAVSITTGSSPLTINLGATTRECGKITVGGSAKLTFSRLNLIQYTSVRLSP